MPLDLSLFRQRIQNNGGPAPVNRFEVTFLAPPVINLQNLTYFCEQAELPGRSLATLEDKLYGPVRKIAYASIYVETTMTFLCTNNGLDEKRFFDSWQDLINDNTSFDVDYYDNYTCDIKVDMLDERNNSNYICTFREAWPLNVGVINLSQNSNNDYARLNVTFAYRKWDRNKPASSSQSFTIIPEELNQNS